MRFLRWIGVLLAFVPGASAAGLVPVAPAPPQPALPPAGLEVNQGQAAAGILFLCRGAGLAVTAQSALYSPLGATLVLVASNPNPAVSFSDALPGLVNAYTGANPQSWITGIPQYGTATLTAIYPGVNAQYTISANGILTLNLLLAAGANPSLVQFQIPQAASLTANSAGGLTARMPYSSPQINPQAQLVYAAPIASPGSGAAFVVQSPTTFGVVVQGLDASQPLEISIPVSGVANFLATETVILPVSDAAGNSYYATSVPDNAGNSAPFPSIGGVGCGIDFNEPIACADVAVSKYSAAGELQFITYLEGQYSESPGFLGIAPNGSLVVAGTTDSANFPVTASAAQPAYAGPPAMPQGNEGEQPAGNFFAAVLDPTLGHLQASTFLGGPNAASMGTAALGADGSLYFLPELFTGSFVAGMPVTAGALQSACQGNPCQNAYAAHLSPGLDQLLYGTYLPGLAEATAQLYSDGSVYYAGSAAAGFPATPNAYQPQNNTGSSEGFIARLDPTGSKLLFGTYFGGPNSAISPMIVAPDGSVWAGVSGVSPGSLIHLDGSGSTLLADVPIEPGPMVLNNAGDLFTFAGGAITVSPGAILGGSCGGPAYVEVSPTGQQLFATYLPVEAYGFDGADTNGTPFLDTPSGRVEVVQSQSTSPYAGCVVEAASYLTLDEVSPGEIVTIFGSGMGPVSGVGFQLVNGQVPTLLGGTQVLVNGEPAPLLYASYGQINLILPYSLAVGATPAIQVVTNGTPLSPLSSAVVIPEGIYLFQVNGEAVALNQDGTVNSPQNPAQPGSTVSLFGTGGGQTNPPSTAGQITPLALWPLALTPQAEIVYVVQPGGPPGTFVDAPINVEYAGAAPALISGVTQVNVTLPNVIPAIVGYPPGTLPLGVIAPGTAGSNVVTISIAPN
jgi:uncharacterized protein (TIGR03437 family)